MQGESAGASPLGRDCRTVAERSVTGMPETPVTLRDVAARAGVHPATASRALNPETRLLVRGDTALRVLQAAEFLGYRPNPVARSLRTRRSNTIGVLIPDLNNPLFPPIVRGIEDRLAAAGYVALPGNTDGDTERERIVFEQMRARHVDGFVLATAHLHDPVLAEATGLPRDPERVVAAKAFSVDEGLRCARLLLERGRVADRGPATAVVAANDRLALGCYAALDEAGLGCPEDLSVVGFNDMPFIDRLRPPLTTIRFPHYQVGQEAAQLLLERIAGHTGPVKILFLAPELVVRGSTAPYGPAAPPVR